MEELLKMEIEDLESKLKSYEEESDYLNEYNLLNKNVKNVKYGEGKIIEQRNNIITIKFTSGEQKTFKIPMSFIQNFLTSSDSSVLESQQKLYHELLVAKEQIEEELKEKREELNNIINANKHKKYVGNETFMLAVLTNVSFEDCIKHNIYCCKANHRFSKGIEYLALYGNKSINSVGRVKKIIKAQYQTDKWIWSLYRGSEEVSKKDIEQIENLRTRGLELFNCDIGEYEHYYFIIDKFVLTDFRKTSNYPLQHTKYFNLCEVLQTDLMPEIEEMGKLLCGKEW